MNLAIHDFGTYTYNDNGSLLAGSSHLFKTKMFLYIEKKATFAK